MILRNRAKCLKCGDIIESKHRHDFQWCSCKSCFVDGGRDYLRRGGEIGQMEDMSEFGDAPDEDEACEQCGRVDDHKLSCTNKEPFQPSGVLR